MSTATSNMQFVQQPLVQLEPLDPVDSLPIPATFSVQPISVVQSASESSSPASPAADLSDDDKNSPPVSPRGITTSNDNKLACS